MEKRVWNIIMNTRDMLSMINKMVSSSIKSQLSHDTLNYRPAFGNNINCSHIVTMVQNMHSATVHKPWLYLKFKKCQRWLLNFHNFYRKIPLKPLSFVKPALIPLLSLFFYGSPYFFCQQQKYLFKIWSCPDHVFITVYV